MEKCMRVPASAAAALIACGVASACPTCRSALAASGERWSQGFAASIAILLGALALVGGSFGFALWRATREPAGGDGS